jgi:glycosyltransferase involved in cell wall biosynthesis
VSVTGIVWVGPLLDRGGYGNVSRNFVKGLHRIGFPVRTFNVGPEHAEVDHADADLVRRLATADVGPRPMAVVNSLPETLRLVHVSGVARKVCCSIFETDRIPSTWLRDFERYDEVWVPSGFNVRTYRDAGVPAQKLVKIPYGIDVEAFAPRDRRDRRRFRLLYCFAFGWRKGFDLLLRAYREEFAAADDVVLTLKVFASRGEDPSQMRATFRSIFEEDPARPPATLPALEILDEPIAQSALLDVYASADLYVSTDRANGWGMPCFECMAMGVPCATIDWSGSTEFMRAGDALLVPPEAELVPVDERLAASWPEYYAGHRWPQVRVDAVRRVLRWAFDHRGPELETVGRRGRDTILAEFSLEAAARRVVEHVRELAPVGGRRAMKPRVFLNRDGPLWWRGMNAVRRSLSSVRGRFGDDGGAG